MNYFSRIKTCVYRVIIYPDITTKVNIRCKQIRIEIKKKILSLHMNK